MMQRRIIVRGRVQGVGFRAWTERAASSLGLSGTVWNRNDGGVELLVAGEEAVVNELVRKLHQGPPAAHVATVEVEPADEPIPSSGFTITR